MSQETIALLVTFTKRRQRHLIQTEKRNKQGNLQLRTCPASGFRETRKYIGVKSQSFCIVYYLTLF